MHAVCPRLPVPSQVRWLCSVMQNTIYRVDVGLGPPHLESMFHALRQCTATNGWHSQTHHRERTNSFNTRPSTSVGAPRSWHHKVAMHQQISTACTQSSQHNVSANRSAPACSLQLTDSLNSSATACHLRLQHRIHSRAGYCPDGYSINAQRGTRQRTRQPSCTADATSSQHSLLEGDLPTPLPVPHEPVLLQEVLEFFAGVQLGTFMDGTLGAGGHAAAITAQHQVDCHPITYTSGCITLRPLPNMQHSYRPISSSAINWDRVQGFKLCRPAVPFFGLLLSDTPAPDRVHWI